ncbi:unnamed protein product, partial [Ixodes persulcatus]
DHLAPTDTVELVFRSCSHLNLPLFVQFMAVEYLDRSCVQNISDKYKDQLWFLLQRSNKASTGRLHWKELYRITDQTTAFLWQQYLPRLRVLAPKKPSVVSINAVRRFLRSASQSYSAASVLQSEKRVLSTLQFRVEFPTPLVYLEVLLDVIGHNDPSFEGEEVYPAAVRVLQGFYLMRIQVYDMALRDLLPDKAACDDRRRRCNHGIDSVQRTLVPWKAIE